MASIRVFIADAYCIVRLGLRYVCEQADGIEVVGEARDGRQAVEMVRQLRPDVVLMDIDLPALIGVEAIRQIVDTAPSARIIVLSRYHQERYIFESIIAGAQGYLLKDIDEAALVTAIREVHKGGSFINPVLAAKLLDEFRYVSQNKHNKKLTPAEMDVLQLVACGGDNKEVAGRLCLSERTVANRLSCIYEKLQVNNRTQAALVALKRGWAFLEQELPNPPFQDGSERLMRQ